MAVSERRRSLRSNKFPSNPVCFVVTGSRQGEMLAAGKEMQCQDPGHMTRISCFLTLVCRCCNPLQQPVSLHARCLQTKLVEQSARTCSSIGLWDTAQTCGIPGFGCNPGPVPSECRTVGRYGTDIWLVFSWSTIFLGRINNIENPMDLSCAHSWCHLKLKGVHELLMSLRISVGYCTVRF